MHTESIDPRDVFLRLYIGALAANETVGLIDRRLQQAEAHGASDDDIAHACRAGLDLFETRRQFPSLATSTSDDEFN